MDALREYLESNEKPDRKKLLALLEESDLPEEFKETVKQLLSAGVPKIFGDGVSGTYLAYLFILVSFGTLFFFGYKLYKSIKDKEVKKEEKKKQKLMKKKK